MGTDVFFKDYASALLTYKAENIAAYYMVPLTVYSDDGILQVADMSEVVGFWQQGLAQYKKLNIVRTIPEIVKEEQLSKTITLCKICWKNYNSEGTEVQSETNAYILSHTNKGYKIVGLIIPS